MAHLLGTQKDKRPDESGLLKVGGVDGTSAVETTQFPPTLASPSFPAFWSFAQNPCVGDPAGWIVGRILREHKPGHRCTVPAAHRSSYCLRTSAKASVTCMNVMGARFAPSANDPPDW